MRPIRTSTTLRAAGLLAATALVVAACSSSSSPSPSSAASAAASASPGSSPAASAGAVTIQAAQSATLGAYLTGPNGMTLYTFKRDSAGKSACTGTCASTWPPLTVASGSSASGGPGVTGTFGTITRDDGSAQVTYDGAPLYYYAADQKPGDTLGQGVGGVWFVATPSGSAGASPSGGASPSPSAGSGGYGGGYGGAVPVPGQAVVAGW